MFKKFLSYYKPHKKVFVLDLIASLFVALIAMGYPIITRYMLSYWIPNKNLILIIIGGCSLLGIYIIRALLRYFIQYYGHIMGVHMQAKMRDDLFNKLQKLPYSYYDNHETGSIISTMTTDLFDISEVAHHGPENILIAGLTVLGAIIYLLTINWILGLILFVVVPLLFIITWHFRKQFAKSMSESRKSIAKINVRLENSIFGIRVTKAFTNDELEHKKFDKSNQEFVDIRKQIFSSMSNYFSISQFITDFFNVIVLLVGGVLLYLGFNQFRVAEFSTFVISVSLFITPINQLINFLELFESSVSGFKRFAAILDEKEEKIYEGKKVLNKLNGDLKFDHVTFSYNDKEVVLNDISFTLEKGKTLALVGQSGGGKSTICHLIPRFYFLKKGQGNIYLDNVDTAEYTLSSLRQHIGIVQQDVFLFGGSIKDNILYGKPNASEEELIDAAKKANILDYINSLPDGWNTDIGERGVKLSGGQKQRLSIARIFLKNPPLLILDEATSALDNATEFMIQDSLNKLAKGRTCIIVAHRLSTIKNADIIAYIGHGKILEMGSHEELLKNNKHYRELYDLQFRLSNKTVENK